MKNHGFIFARGGSKGLPGKNTMQLLGKPLLQYSIEVAQDAPSIDRIYVSTDDESIATVAEHAGAEVIWRPLELATDTSPEWLSWRHAVEWVRKHIGEFDGFVSLPATSPLRNVEDVENAIVVRAAKSADMCIGITDANRSPFFNMVKLQPDGFLGLVIEPENEVYRRQDAPKLFDVTTVVYAADPNFIMSQYGIFSGKLASIFIPKDRAIDIDDIYDFMLAEAILKMREK